MPSVPLLVRPALAAVVLLAAVALTGFVLFVWWPGGVAIGVAVGAGSVLAIGAQMQRTNTRVPSDEVLERRLGMAADLHTADAIQAPSSTATAAAASVPLAVRAADTFFSTKERDAPRRRAAEPAQEPAPAAVVVAPAEPAVVEPAEPAPAAAVAQPELVEPAVVAPAAGAVLADEVTDDAAGGTDARDIIPSTDFVLTDGVDGGADRFDERVAHPDPEHLKAELGADYDDFARAARLVVATQYASAARLQRDLAVPYSRARRLLSDLEQQHFVGPATGSLPRVVLMPKDRLPEVERLLTEA